MVPVPAVPTIWILPDPVDEITESEFRTPESYSPVAVPPVPVIWRLPSTTLITEPLSATPSMKLAPDPPLPVTTMPPVPLLVIAAPVRLMPEPKPTPLPATFAESVIFPSAVEMLDPLPVRISRVVVSEIAPVPLVAKSLAALGRLIVLPAFAVILPPPVTVTAPPKVMPLVVVVRFRPPAPIVIAGSVARVSVFVVSALSDESEVSVRLSFAASPKIESAPVKPESIEVMVMVSSPLPALMVMEFVGFANVTLSASDESIVIVAPVASTSEMLSVPPVKSNTRSVAARLSVMGSRPV